jgi:hypothetical protein
MSRFFPNFWRFLALTAVQVLLLKQLSVAIGAYFNILIYPLFLFFLPMQIAVPYAVLLGFASGMTVDLFYGSIGVHASAGAFSGLLRNAVFKGVMGKNYTGKEPIFSPHHTNWPSYLRASALFFALHLLWYFSVDAFTFVYMGTITLKTLSAWGLTMIFVWLYAAMFNPRA